MNGDDADGDALVGVLGGALDALLAPEGNNDRPVGDVVVEKWQSDELSLDALRRFADDLQEQAVEAPYLTDPELEELYVLARYFHITAEDALYARPAWELDNLLNGFYRDRQREAQRGD